MNALLTILIVYPYIVMLLLNSSEEVDIVFTKNESSTSKSSTIISRKNHQNILEASSIPKIKIHHKWQGVNVQNISPFMLCATESNMIPPKGYYVQWTLSESQKENVTIRFEKPTKSMLIIMEPETSAESEYVCQLCHENKTCIARDSFNLTLYNETRDSTLSVLIVVGEGEIEVRENANVVWTLDVASTNEDIFIEEADDITYDYNYGFRCEKYESKVGYFKFSCNITKTRVQRDDSRVYKFAVTNWQAVAKIKLRLFVYSRVQYSLNGIQEVYSLRKRYPNPTCTVTGLIMDEQEKIMKSENPWFFQECDIFVENDCLHRLNESAGVKARNLQMKVVDKGKKFIKMTLENFVPQHSGVLVCLRDPILGNEEDREKSRADVCVSDGPHTLQHNSVGSLIEGAAARLSCKISHCNYNKNVTWYYGDSGDFDTNFEEVTKGLKVVTGESHSSRSELSVDSLKSGTYFCQARHNRNGVQRKAFRITPQPSNAYIIVIAVLSGLTTTAVTVAAAVYWRRRKERQLKNLTALLDFRKGDIPHLDDKIPLSEQAPLLKFDKKWEFPRDRLIIGRQLGSGFYGHVFQADAIGLLPGQGMTPVAVKMPKKFVGPEVVSAFIGELKIMSHLGQHSHVVNLLGAVVDRLAENELIIIVELCPYGSLEQYLFENKHRFVNLELIRQDGYEIPQNYENTAALLCGIDNAGNVVNSDNLAPLNTNVLLEWAFQITRGMEWLSAKRVIHGDLALRNVLLTHDNIIKISDFGLSKSLNYCEYTMEKETNVKLPVKWLSPEVLEHRKFSVESDVWAFGITLWEMFGLGSVPYPEFASYHEIWHALRNGYRMPKPFYAPQGIYDEMLSCWEADPQKRPTFAFLSSKLLTMLDEESQKKLTALGDSSSKQQVRRQTSESFNAVLRADRMYVQVLPSSSSPDFMEKQPSSSRLSLAKGNMYTVTPQ